MSELPLITYTPNYHELPFTKKLVPATSIPYFTKWHGASKILLQVDITFYFEIETFSRQGTYLKNKLDKESLQRYIGPPSTIPNPIQQTIYFILKEEDESRKEEILRDFSIVFGAIDLNLNYGKYYYSSRLLDNKGNNYRINGSLKPGPYRAPEAPKQNMRDDMNFFMTWLGEKTEILPDSMIDWMIRNELLLLLSPEFHDPKHSLLNNHIRSNHSNGLFEGPLVKGTAFEYMRSREEKIIIFIASPKQPIASTPHRAFLPTLELASYIQSLETKKEVTTIEVQTNALARPSPNVNVNKVNLRKTEQHIAALEETLTHLLEHQSELREKIKELQMKANIHSQTGRKTRRRR